MSLFSNIIIPTRKVVNLDVGPTYIYYSCGKVEVCVSVNTILSPFVNA
jgi:hypothetical protein